MSNVSFRPVRGTQATIDALPKTDGYVYYAVDTGRIYMDKGDERISMGGGSANGSTIYFGTYGQAIKENTETKMYNYPIESLEDKNAEPRIDDMILDEAGALYRIKRMDEEFYYCTLLPLSGNGNGTGPTIIRPTITIASIPNPIIINGQPFSITFTATSIVEENGTPLADTMTVYWSLIDKDTSQVYYKGTPRTDVKHGVPYTLPIGDYLKESADTVIELYAEALNHDEASALRQANVTTVEMYLEHTSRYNPANRYSSDNVNLECNVVGNLSKILEWSIDGVVAESKVLSNNALTNQSFKVPPNLATHGYHTVEINLYQNLGTAESPKKGIAAEPLIYEIAVTVTGDQTPIIWLGSYQDTYYNYDTIQIPFLVYNPADTSSVEVRLKKNDVEIDGSPRTITEFSTYSYWQIADADLNRENYYSIECGKTIETTVVREIKFKVIPDPNRDMTVVKQSSLKLNFDPAGRSNAEPAAKRSSWSYMKDGEEVKALFENFNWYNNGWYTDNESKSTYLRISNGAKFTIPFQGGLEFGTSDTSKQSNAIELAFKVRNIQNYDNLITNVTRYNIPQSFKDNGEVNTYIRDDNVYKAFTEQTDYNNYDAYLQATLEPNIYDNLQFREVQKNINLSNAVFGFYSGDDKSVVGACVGSQDTFFSNGFDTVNVSFVENEMVYLSFVYEHTPEVGSKLYIYINGCITGVIESSISGNTGFKINSNAIVFNSEVCDIDLYKMRIYNTALTVNDIVTNHAVDKKDIIIYDQNGLATENQALQEFQLDFNKILDWNKEHPDIPLMPYIIYDTSTTTSDDKLPYAKANGATDVRVEFVNTPLDTAYARGELVKKAVEDGLLDEFESNQDVIDEAVKIYYKHHCPSWTSTMSTGDIVGIEVQGTSSEFYPRRNFKIKTKHGGECCWGDLEDDDGNVIGQGWTEEECLNIFMNKGPFEEIFEADKEKLKADEHYYGYEESRMFDGWYMNNYTNPTDRWTMKVDYMESSGSYNAGFASLVGNAYTKHPLEDYVKAGVLTNTDKLESEVFDKMRWEDYRTSLLGFPVMAFHKRKKKGTTTGETEYVFIGYYRMLLDKGSDQVLGFKPSKKIEHTLLGNQRLRDVAECWEFSTNARTFCSYKDPWNRVELSFKGPKSEGDSVFIKLEGGKIGGPMVLNHFEPRYFAYEDYLKNDEDGFYNFGNLDQETVDAICDDLGIESIDIASEDAKYKAQDAAVDLMKNWEKVCKWIYSTNLDNVKSQGQYSVAPVGKVKYEPGKFYVLDTTNLETGYSISNDEFDANQTYFEITEYEVEIEKLDEEGNPMLDAEGNPIMETVTRETFTNAYATLEEYLYSAGKFYIEVAGVYSLCNEAEFDTSTVYYIFTSLKDEEIALIADLLVAPATEYVEGTQYYTYNSDAKVNTETGITGAVVPVDSMNAERFAANKGLYYVAAPKTYATTTYKYDTKEYRTAKFMNELKDHFDLEYLATYFVMTEVFECYDSRGKNCMMASWGPQKENGDYIWYPIFYDIDTQLGINNTGIPSFEFNVDATEAGNYSTSDSILWNNFYKFFKGSQILNKYKNLRNQDSTFTKLKNPPLQSVDYLEKWYTQEETTTKNIANRGMRPLIATNLDMFYKYITITNPKAEDQGVAYIPGADGQYAYDKDGTYFYALQGDRSQSRRQFLTNRIEYIDSWLNQGNYQRGGNNRIRGRISANSGPGGKTSDWWIETETEPYWKDFEFGTKTHDFDAEYWLTLKPVRSAYVTAGDDSANYPSQKYDGKAAVNFKLSDIETGVRKSNNYPEQLVYIYGMNQMADFGNMNNLYWTEFYMEGNADHLTRLQLGYDGGSKTDSGNWYNQKLNGIKLSDMPLLQEANFSNIGLDTQTSLDLTASEKLENLRAVGTSNLTGISFADGVALNTLYIPTSMTSLKLVQANLLTNLIDQAEAPTPTIGEDGVVTPPTQGLYIDGFFGGETNSSNLTSIYFNGGSLGYGTFKILDRFFKTRNTAASTVNRITMTDVKWTPYVKLTEGAIYDEEETNYYIDNEHYGFEKWTNNATTFNELVLNGKLYLYTPNEDSALINDDFLDMIQKMQGDYKEIFSDASSNESNPIISGIVYVENNAAVEESWIRNTLQPMYPNLTFFFKTVTKAYSAQFLYRDLETGVDSYVKFANGDTAPSVQKISKADYDKDNDLWFENPSVLYAPTKAHYDFIGWSTDPEVSPTDLDNIIEKDKAEEWTALKIDPEVYDYIYYAIFKIHDYEIIFYDGDGSVLSGSILPYGTPSIPVPTLVPGLDDSGLDLYETNTFVGYTDNTLTNKIVDPTQITVRGKMEFWPVFDQVDVYTNIHPEYFHGDFYTGEYGTTGVELYLDKRVQGKITIPKVFKMEDGKEYPVLALNATFATTYNAESGKGYSNGDKLTHVFFEKGTSIEAFLDYAFFGHNTQTGKSALTYVEFPDTLLTIGWQCFIRCSLLDYRVVTQDPAKLATAVIRGAKIRQIGEQAFQQAFKTYSVTDFQIGPSVETLQSRVFNNTGISATNLLIGTPNEDSKLVIYTADRIMNKATNVLFYTSNYTEDDIASLQVNFPGAEIQIK